MRSKERVIEVLKSVNFDAAGTLVYVAAQSALHFLTDPDYKDADAVLWRIRITKGYTSPYMQDLFKDVQYYVRDRALSIPRYRKVRRCFTGP